MNNGYSNKAVDTEIEAQVKSLVDQGRKESNKNNSDYIQLYYRNFMSSAYKVDERVVRSIIQKNVKCSDRNKTLNVIIYYRNKKTRNLVMKNNLNASREKLKCTNVVYQFICPHEDCRLRQAIYIGVTTTSLSRRLTMHLRDGAPKEHMEEQHKTPLTRQHLTANTTIITSCHDKRKLAVLESLHIHEQKPTLNKQTQQHSSLSLWGNNTG